MRIKKHKERLNESKIRLITYMALMLGFAQSLLIYVESSYFKLSLGSENVSPFYFVSYAIALFFLLNMHKVIRKIGKSTTFFLAFFLQIFSVIMLTMVKPSIIGIGLLMLYIIASYLVIVLMDIILESYSEDKKSGRIRGFHLMMTNVGFILGPLISTNILERFDYFGLFFIAMIINMCIFVVGLIGLRGGNSRFGGNLTVKDLVRKIFVNKDLMRIYWISFALEFFYALMVLYTPLYLLDLGMGWREIGIIFTFMLVPFTLFGYPIGIIADKWLGEKEMIIGALILISFSTVSIFFIQSNSLVVWSTALFITRVGAAMVETLRDSYFYKKIDATDMDIISFFRTARSTATLFSAGITSILLVFISLKFVFLFVGVAVLLGLYPAFTLVDNKSESEMDAELEGAF